MTVFRSLPQFVLTGALLFTAGAVMAQHDVGGGSTRDAASGAVAESTRGTTSVKRSRTRASTSAVRRPRAPLRRGITAEQYNQQGDEVFKAEQYSDALEAYT